MTRRGAQRGRMNEAIVLFVLFFGPVFVALLAYLGPWEMVPDRSTAYGVLIDPARPLPGQEADAGDGVDWLRRRWSLIYLSAGGCDRVCESRLAELGRIHKALAEDRNRVQRVLLHPVAAAPPAAVDLLSIPLEGEAAAALQAELLAAHPGPIYVSDPLGNLVLAYPADARDKGILKDLERLLRLSRIG